MSGVTFTPGPWSNAVRGNAVHGDRDEYGWTEVCLSPCANSPLGSKNRKQWEADAALIAAAPGMYAACVRMLTHIDDVKSDDDLMECRKAIVEALAKARGES